MATNRGSEGGAYPFQSFANDLGCTYFITAHSVGNETLWDHPTEVSQRIFSNRVVCQEKHGATVETYPVFLESEVYSRWTQKGMEQGGQEKSLSYQN